MNDPDQLKLFNQFTEKAKIDYDKKLDTQIKETKRLMEIEREAIK